MNKRPPPQKTRCAGYIRHKCRVLCRQNWQKTQQNQQCAACAGFKAHFPMRVRKANPQTNPQQKTSSHAYIPPGTSGTSDTYMICIGFLVLEAAQ